jgi:large repetitive protein
VDMETATVTGDGTYDTPNGYLPMAAGTYQWVASYSGDANNNSVATTGSESEVVSQGTPTVTASDLGGTYDGDSFPASGTATGVGGATVSGSFVFDYYVGSTATGTPTTTAPTKAGTYTVVAAFRSSDGNYTAGPTDSNPLTFTIGQATPTVSVSDAGGTYNGNSFPATDSVTGVSGTPGSTLEGVGLTLTYYAASTASGTPLSGAPSTAGTYTVVASFAGSTDYMDASNSTTFTINKATPKVTASDGDGTYNGNPFPATATATGVGGASVSGNFAFTYYVGGSASGTGSSTAPTNAGTYTVVAAFTSSNTNYVTGPTDSAAVTFTIGQATPAVAATDAGGPANGSSYPASATATGVGGATVSGSFTFTYYVGSTASGSGSSTAPSTAGTYTVVAAFTSTNSNYVTGPTDSAPVTFAITPVSSNGPAISAPMTASVNENASLVFSTANGNAISVTDSSAGNGTEQLTLTATHGTLTLATTKGLTLTTGSSSSSITIKGTLANLNAVLNGLRFTPMVGYSGSASLAISYKDLGDSRTASATVAMTVVVPASQPTVTIITLVPLAVPGEPVPLVLVVSDTNASAQAAALTFAVSFGDGDSTTISSTSPVLITHVYTKTGTFTVSVTATDEYGHTSAKATATIKVVSVAIETDPLNKNETALFVGTSGTETVGLAASGTSGIAVTVNGASEGTYSTSGPIFVFGQGGKDTVKEGAGLKNPVYLLESPTADNVETDLDNEALQWAGLAAALDILNA